MVDRAERQQSIHGDFGHWLITGGAGYIGSHLASEFALLNIPFSVVDFDQIKMDARLPAEASTYFGDIRNIEELDSVFKENNFSGVIHLAALKSVDESQKNSRLYRETNVDGTHNLLNVMKKNQVKNLVFSSTAAVYGETKLGVVTESTKIEPISYYGKTKVIAESLIEDAEKDFGLKFVNLRYFNVAGALNKKLQDDSKENLIPIIIDQINSGIMPTIFGSDYPTRDGTAIRDYIHVIDVIGAHIAAIEYLLKGGASQTLNIGTGIGTTVLEIVSEILIQKSSNLIPNLSERRAGDIGIVVADSSKAESVLGFKAKHTLTEMIASVL